MGDCTINFTKNTITISKRFALAASKPDTAEFEKLSKLQAAYPGMRIVHKTHRSPSRANMNKGLTYDRMERYINLHENAAELLITFKAVKEIAAKQKNPYQFTRGWFVKQFPAYGTLPDIDSGGKILGVPVVPATSAAAEQNEAAEISEGPAATSAAAKSDIGLAS